MKPHQNIKDPNPKVMTHRAKICFCKPGLIAPMGNKQFCWYMV